MTAKDYYPYRDLKILILRSFETEREEPTLRARAGSAIGRRAARGRPDLGEPGRRRDARKG